MCRLAASVPPIRSGGARADRGYRRCLKAKLEILATGAFLDSMGDVLKISRIRPRDEPAGLNSSAVGYESTRLGTVLLNSGDQALSLH